MTTVLEEVNAPDLTREHVERRLDDWADRIDRLYRLMESWLPEGWSAERAGSVIQDEPMMREFGLPPRRLPVLFMKSSDDELVLRPRALWIIGMNGRLDLIGSDRHWLIVDRAENFAPPSWVIVPLDDRGASRPLDEHSFRAALQRA